MCDYKLCLFLLEQVYSSVYTLKKIFKAYRYIIQFSGGNYIHEGSETEHSKLHSQTGILKVLLDSLYHVSNYGKNLLISKLLMSTKASFIYFLGGFQSQALLKIYVLGD